MAKKTRKTKKTEKKDIKENQEAKRNIAIPKRLVFGIIVGLIVVFLVIVIGKNVMNMGKEKAELGNKVGVMYTGRLDTGEIFDTNVKDIAEKNNMSKPAYEPLEFTVGAGQMIKGFDNAVVSMTIGQKKTIEIQPEEAYGAYNAKLVQTMSLDQFKSTLQGVEDLQEGMELMYRTPEGQVGTMRIKSLGPDFVTLDFNHKLAGKKLIFDIELVSIQK